MSSAPQIPQVKLSNGMPIPALGFGTGTSWYKPDRFSAFNPDLVPFAKSAIQAGYRLLDAAEGYGTEPELGQAIQEAGVPRDELFVIDKISFSIIDGKADNLAAALDDSLAKLKLDYLDLLLLHTPYINNNTYSESDVAQVWKHMEAAQRAGKVRAIGVSNFRRTHMDNLLKTAEIKPVMNQIQYNPYIQGGPQYVQWLHSQGITVASWMGLAPITWLKGMHLEDTLKDLSAKYGVSESAILIRWQLDQSVVVLNTTKKLERMQEYFQALSLELTAEDADKITTIGQEKHVRVPVGDFFDGHEFGPY